VQPAHAVGRRDRLLGDVDEAAVREHLAILLLKKVRLLGEERDVVLAEHVVARASRKLLARAVEALVAQRRGVLDEHHRRDVLDDRIEEAVERPDVARPTQLVGTRRTLDRDGAHVVELGHGG
jgi:hypothetical protein